MKIFLFDMDGVLLESRGYHLALQETVRRMAMALGFGDCTLSPDDIAAFEAGGITCEWDEAAICAASFLDIAWKDESGCNLPDSLAQSVLIDPGRRSPPNFYALAQALSTPEMLSLHPLERAELYFLKRHQHSISQEHILRSLILGARMAELSLTYRTFQELVLGSTEFFRAYNLASELDCESYLLKYDHSNLPDADRDRLKNWISIPHHAAAVITSRPSHPPVGIFSTPEAEIGAKLVGLDGIPILGWGGMCWLGLQRHSDPQSLIKPSPVHALAGLRMACGESQETALSAAADLVETRYAGSGWKQFTGAQVCVFEDTPGGIKSLQAAQEILIGSGVRIETKSIGIAQKQIKIKALIANKAEIFPSLIDAINFYME